MSENPNPLPPSPCPQCGSVNDAATAVSIHEARPRPGDVGVCFSCGALVQYDADLLLTALPRRELAAMPLETLLALLTAQQVILIRLAGDVSRGTSADRGETP